MASFYKRGPYQWEARVRLRGFPAQQKTFESKVEAQMWAADVELSMHRGMFVDRSEATKKSLRQIVEQYLEEVTPLHKGAADEAKRLRAIARRPLCDTHMANLTAADFAKYRDSRLKEVAPATVVRELGMLSAVINQAIREWNINIPANPVAHVKRPRVRDARTRRLQPAPASGKRCEEERQLAACQADGTERATRVPWLRPIVDLAIETAMRRGEILSLQWERIDLKKRTAHLEDTKNGESRTVPLSSRAVTVLREWQPVEDQRTGPVFDVTANALKLAWARAVRRARLKDFRFHDLRHEATSRIATKLTNVLELSAVTGHKDLSMLKRYYHPDASDLALKLG